MTFKKNCRFLAAPGTKADSPEAKWIGNRTLLAISFLCLMLALTACRTLPPLPQADFSQPGWTVQQGQALWKMNRDAPEIAGEILLATNLNGRTLVQFAKTPFPLVIAQTAGGAWQVEAPVENKRFAGGGSPPQRIIWFHLPRVLAHSPLPKNWISQNIEDGWRLENVATGESLEGYFAQSSGE